jgi:hypothetical protein
VLGIVIGAVVGLLANWFFYRKAKKSKRLSWEILSMNRIIQASDLAREKFTVLHGDTEVKDPNLFVIRIGNTGTEAVLAAHFGEKGSITVDFSPAKLLLLDVVRRSDPDISDHLLVQNAHDMVYLPEYLNPNEWLDFQFITDGELQRPQIKGRFSDSTHPFREVRDIPYRTHKLPGFVVRTAFVVSAVVIGVVLLLIYYAPSSRGLLAVLFAIFLAAISVFLLGLWQVYKQLRQFFRERPSFQWRDGSPALEQTAADDEKSTVASGK